MKIILAAIFISLFALSSCSKENEMLTTTTENHQIQGMSKADDLPSNPIDGQGITPEESVNLCYSQIGD